MKTCTLCLEAKPVTEFSIHRSTNDGLNYRCRSCNRSLTKAWSAANPEKKREMQRRWQSANPEKKAEADRRHYEKHHDAIRQQAIVSRLKSRYGITPEDYDRFLEQQGGCCPICGTDEPGKKGWHVDHCHETKVVRGLLCASCNVKLGILEQREWQVQAEAFLQNHR